MGNEVTSNEVAVSAAVPAAPPLGEGEWSNYFRDQAVDIALRGSGLPAAMQDSVRLQLEGAGVTPDRLERVIAQHKAMLAALREDQTVTGMGKPLDGGVVISVRAPIDAFANAMDWMFGVRDAKLPPPDLRKTPFYNLER